MELNPLAWVYFVSFVIVGTFVVVNLFIAVVTNNLDRAKEDALLKSCNLLYRAKSCSKNCVKHKTTCAGWRRGSQV